MNWMAFATHFAACVIGGTAGVLTMALLTAGRDGGVQPTRCKDCKEFRDGNCFLVNRGRKPLDFCSKGVPDGR